ncbi:MAG TPA: thioesterase family protein [Acidimicrobiia bacterium]
MPAEPDALFHLDATAGGRDRFVPTELTRGPWDPGAMHGGAPAALLARAVERFEPGPASHVARVTVDLLRPVPLEPVEVRARMLRPGKKVQIVEASLVAREAEVVRMTALRLREADLALPEAAAREDRLEPGPGQARQYDDEGPLDFGHAVDMSLAHGSWEKRGPAAVWFRLAVPVVAGESASPLSRVMAAADFGNGISSSLDWNEGWTFVNPDLTVYLHRLPATEWVGVDAVTWPEGRGIAVAEARLYDERGRIGRSVQSLLLDRR